MSASVILGYILLAMPFAVVFVLAARYSGFLMACSLFALVGCIVAVIALGSYLVTGGAA